MDGNNIEDRGVFLRRKKNNKENEYNGWVLVRENHNDTFRGFLKQFKPINNDAYYKEYLMDLVTREDLIIDTDSVYVFCVNGMPLDERNALKAHLVQNYLVNWDSYEKYIHSIKPGVEGNITIETITSVEISEEFFDRNTKEEKDKNRKKADIQFIYLIDKASGYMNDWYFEALGRFIGPRNSRGLITIIFFANF